MANHSNCSRMPAPEWQLEAVPVVKDSNQNLINTDGF